MWYHSPVILALGRQSHVHLWSLLVTHSSPLGKFQASERPFLKKRTTQKKQNKTRLFRSDTQIDLSGLRVYKCPSAQAPTATCTCTHTPAQNNCTLPDTLFHMVPSVCFEANISLIQTQEIREIKWENDILRIMMWLPYPEPNLLSALLISS